MLSSKLSLNLLLYGMMITNFLFLLVMMTISFFLASYPGKICVDWLGYNVDFPVSIAIYLLIGCFFIYIFLQKIIRKILKLPIIYQRFVLKKRRAKGQSLLIDSLSALSAGQPQEAKDLIYLCQEFVPEDSILTYFLAQSVFSLNDVAGAQKLYTQMLAHPRLNFLGAQGLYQCARAQKNWEEAYTHLVNAFSARSDSPWVVSELCGVILLLEKVRDVSSPSLHKILPKDLYQKFEAARLWSRLERVIDENERLIILKKIYKACPSWVVPNYYYAMALEKQHKKDKARSVIFETYQKNPHRLLGHGLFKCEGSSEESLLFHTLQPLVSLHPQHFESILLEAQGAFEARILDKAIPLLRDLYERTQKVDYLVLLEQLQKMPHLQDINLPSPLEIERSFAWRCCVCHFTSNEWNALCTQCLHIDSMEWVDLSPRLELKERNNENAESSHISYKRITSV